MLLLGNVREMHTCHHSRQSQMEACCCVGACWWLQTIQGSYSIGDQICCHALCLTVSHSTGLTQLVVSPEHPQPTPCADAVARQLTHHRYDGTHRQKLLCLLVPLVPATPVWQSQPSVIHTVRCKCSFKSSVTRLHCCTCDALMFPPKMQSGYTDGCAMRCRSVRSTCVAH